jgi:uncharacterized protein YecT (DUF1311 family)
MIRASLLAVSLLLFTPPASAQTAEDIAAVEACLKTAETRREDAAKATPPETTKPGPEAHLDDAAALARYAPESCIGIVSTPCMQTDEGMSTLGMMTCLGRELEVWDARLNKAYKDAIKPDADSGLDAKSSELVQQNYKTVQRNWIPWRDATCDVLHADGIPIYGSQSKVDAVNCLLNLTARQALWLEGSLGYGSDN